MLRRIPRLSRLPLVLAVFGFTFTTNMLWADEGHRTESPQDAEVYIVNLMNGDEVTSPFRVIFGLHNMGVAPAGVEKMNTGHHHIFINAELTEDMLDYPIPADEQHVHFGGGQTEVMLDLAPGTYTLRLVLGDHNHIPHDPVIQSPPVTVTVVE